MSETPIGDAVEAELNAANGEEFVNDETPESIPSEPEDPQDVDEAVDDPADDDEAGELGNPDDLAGPGPGEDDTDGTAAETSALIDEDEDPGVAVPDDPFGPDYTA